jgi:carbon starvation protein CstA/uncharacterized short protein YbdD (DUF466 family)
VLLGHHFAAIAGAGPLAGPVLAAQMGYLPGTIWIIAGVIFAGAVQDMVVLFFSTRRHGRSLGQMAREEIGPFGGAVALLAAFAIMIILLGVLALVIVNALAESPWGTFSIAMTVPIALSMGFYLRVLRPGRVSEVSLIGVGLLLLALVAGRWVAESSWADTFTLAPATLVIWLVAYGFIASILPVWMLLAPRDYLSTFMKISTIFLLAPFSQITGDSLRAFWYHFAIMFEALFILTALDAGTRVGRFMLQDTLGNVYRPFKDVSWKPGLVICSAIVCGLWGYFLWVGVHEPLGGINQLFPIFGISNQLLAAVAPTVCTTLLVKSGSLKWAWITGVPLAWNATVTLTASYQKVVSSDPKVGFFKQRQVFQDAIDDGRILPPAKTMDDMHAVVTNSTVDGVLSAVLALLVVIVVDPRGEGGASAMRSLRRVLRAVRWYVRELTGEAAYDRHVAHVRKDHPLAPVPTRRSFERMRTDRQESDPRQGFRCC